MKKKILAALMAAVMLFTILPLGTLDTAWAEERASATASEGSVSGGKLLEGYLYRLAGMDIRSYENGFNSSSMAATYSAKANLNAEEQTVYNTLKAEIEKIASGQRKDTNIKTTGVLGSQASADKVWHALLSDLPYELYWHDKVIGINYAYILAADNTPFKDVTFSFAVAQEFRGKDVTTTNIPNVPAAVQTARSVVAANASKADHDKLQAYRQYICDQVSYNYAAARGEYANVYGNPWQLLWVFDGDSTTNVVCEGYAKSFKYLCDLTEESNGWTGDVETISVTGTMGTENHMWNIVRIGGGNYLVDVTNCDTGMKGYPQKLFLRGAVGDGISYTVENTVYTYGTETRTGFAAADLKLSGTDYTPAATTLTAPTVTLKADAASGQPVISWSKVGGATQYEVYRSATGKANSFSIIRRTSALTYTDVNAAAGNTYYYVVRAMKGSGSSAVYSKFSPAQSIQYAITSLNAPSMTLTSAASGQPVISWTRVNGAAQYEIYRSATGKANSFSIIRRTSALTYTDVNAAAGNTYYYVVRAINGSVKSAFCAAQTIKYAITSLTAPTMTQKADTSSGQPVISWTKVSGAAQYEVYRSTNGKNFSIVRRTAALSYTDTSAAAGTTYYYQVRAINGSVKSDFSPAQSIQYAVASLNAPTMTLTSAASGQPVVSWTKVNGAAQYEVYRSTNGKNFSIVRRTAALSFTDTSAAAGNTYYYVVRAINGSVKSAFCAAQSIQYGAKSIKVGFITLHDENSTYDLNFINGAKEAIANLGLTDADYILKTNVPEGQECYDVAVDLAESGCDIIFANSYGHQYYMLQAARGYPDVQFCVASGILAHTSNLSNYHDAYASIYEGRYLAGIAAGMKLNAMIEAGKFTADEAVVGYVGAFPYAEVISAYTAFFLGVRSVCPAATMEVAFTGSWYTEDLEKESAQRLIDRGCKLISQYSDSLGAPVACENAGIPNVSYNGSARAAAPNTYIISSRINWTPYYEYAIGAVMKGENIATDWTGTLATGSVVVEDLNTKVAAAGTAAVLTDVTAKLKNGTIHVFDCNTFTVNGKKVTSYYADVDLDADYTPDTEVIHDGYFAESEFRSAPYFDLLIDGIERLNIVF